MPFHFETGIPAFMFGFLILRGILWVGIFGAAIYLIKKLVENTDTSSTQFSFREEKKPEDSALEIARKRYAEGEISKEEFREIKSELKED